MSAPHPDVERLACIGWALYPMSRASKAGAFAGAADAATCDLDQLARWQHDFPGCGWRVVCGPSGLFVLDVDRPGTHQHDGFASLAHLVDKHGPLPERPMTRTGGSGGAALFFRHAGEPLRGQSGQPAPGLDPHRGRQAVVVPPSTHPITRGAYSWRVAPWEVAPPSIPAWLAKLLAPPPEPRLSTSVPTEEKARIVVMEAMHLVETAPSGAANDTLNRAAYRLGYWCGTGALHATEASSALASAAQRRSIPTPEARATIRSGLQAGQRRGSQRDAR